MVLGWLAVWRDWGLPTFFLAIGEFMVELVLWQVVVMWVLNRMG